MIVQLGIQARYPSKTAVTLFGLAVVHCVVTQTVAFSISCLKQFSCTIHNVENRGTRHISRVMFLIYAKDSAEACYHDDSLDPYVEVDGFSRRFEPIALEQLGRII